MAPTKDIDPYESPLAFFGHEVRRHRARLETTQVQLGKRLYCSDDRSARSRPGRRYRPSSSPKPVTTCSVRTGR